MEVILSKYTNLMFIFFLNFREKLMRKKKELYEKYESRLSQVGFLIILNIISKAPAKF